MSLRLDRRRLLLLSALLATPAVAAGPRSGDNGIGGTGLPQARPGGGDNGIGGTGYIGTIRAFGSVIVNGDRISYADSARIEIDGRLTRPQEMRIGQVVRLLATRQDSALTTERIVILSEVIGPIEAIDRDRLVVLGQSVDVRGISFTTLMQKGMRVSVHGLRRPDGTIVATLVDDRAGPTDQVIGVIKRGKGGLTIGGLRLTGVAASLAGQRVMVRGSAEAGTLRAESATPDPARQVAGAARMSVEAFVPRSGAVSGEESGGFVRAVLRGDSAGPGGFRPREVVPMERLHPGPAGGPHGPGGGRPGGGPGGPAGGRPGGEAGGMRGAGPELPGTRGPGSGFGGGRGGPGR